MLICPYNSFTENIFIDFSSEETPSLTEEQEFTSCKGGKTKKKTVLRWEHTEHKKNHCTGGKSCTTHISAECELWSVSP